jgi:preprotein translocase subunit SecY
MLSKLKQIYYNRDLRKKILYTAALVVVFRLAAHIPVPGVNLENLRAFFSRNQIFGLLDMFSGGAMSNFSVVMMGVAPYINASIIMQLLTMISPRLEALSKEGEHGHRIINKYTRILTIPLAALQSFGMIKLLQSQSQKGAEIIGTLNIFQFTTIIITITAGTVFLMWLGELMTEKGIGNGISLIITIGILARLPLEVVHMFTSATSSADLLKYFGFLILAIIITLGVVYVVEGQRNVPVSYAKRIRGQRMYGGVSSYLPLRVNQGGVIPIIFAMSLMMFPGMIAKFFAGVKTAWLSNTASFVERLFRPDTFIYGALYFLLVVAFNYFYTAIVFNPEHIAENIQKQGGFIPGIRPGPRTVEYLSRLSNRIMLSGGIFLGLIAVLPFIVQAVTGIGTMLDVVGGTGLLIVVSVALETIEQVKSQLIMRSYEGL